MPLLDDCKNDWKKCEGLRLTVYDDKTSLSIVKGSSVQGHPTIGYGRALDVNGITHDESEYLLANDMTKIIFWAEASLPWFKSLNTVRQRVIVNLAGNLGRAGFLNFKGFIAATEANDFKAAGYALLESTAARQAAKRYAWLAVMFQTGEEQPLG